jgi:protein gp37
MSDLFHEAVPFEYIDDVYFVMAECRQHTFQVLTKRPKRALEFFERSKDRLKKAHMDEWWKGYNALPNLWLGVSVENQAAADERIPLLLRTPAAVRFVSAEPLLGPIDLTSYPRSPAPALDWVIVGGESGHNARHFDPAWARTIIAQCRAAGIACFVKQLGSKNIMPLRDRKGGDPLEWPADLRVRQFPEPVMVKDRK